MVVKSSAGRCLPFLLINSLSSASGRKIKLLPRTVKKELLTLSQLSGKNKASHAPDFLLWTGPFRRKVGCSHAVFLLAIRGFTCIPCPVYARYCADSSRHMGVTAAFKEFTDSRRDCHVNHKLFCSEMRVRIGGNERYRLSCPRSADT